VRAVFAFGADGQNGRQQDAHSIVMGSARRFRRTR